MPRKDSSEMPQLAEEEVHKDSINKKRQISLIGLLPTSSFSIFTDTLFQ
jgi:hypothetical protein